MRSAMLQINEYDDDDDDDEFQWGSPPDGGAEYR